MKFKIVLRDLRLNLKMRDACTYALSNAVPTLYGAQIRTEILSVNFKLKYESYAFILSRIALTRLSASQFGQALKFSANLAGFCGFKFLNLSFKFKLKTSAGLN
nr:hypothetical protein [uncultured Campylobacter sp.]